MRYICSLSLALWIASAAPGAGATIDVVEGKEGRASLILVEGELEFGDEQKFVDAALKVRNGVVLLNS